MKKPFNPRALRQRLGLNQQDFWSKVDVTQSGGSRYENGRPIPRAVQRLIGAVYLNQPIRPYKAA